MTKQMWRLPGRLERFGILPLNICRRFYPRPEPNAPLIFSVFYSTVFTFPVMLVATKTNSGADTFSLY